ncbi:Major facilitator superfamily domain- general substrate transporter [Apiospora marii]|uniref:Major facilitator superfamily domain- general substrate transporter n=1 Tax=Apiospora marii TaxID=335849 RepID=A0ABR1R9I6_9PEZI
MLRTCFARHFNRIGWYIRSRTGDGRYRAGEHATAHTLGRRLLVNIYRPFLMSLIFILWTALLVGDLLALPLIPLVYSWPKKVAAAGMMTLEICLWYRMLGGSIALPPSINILVPIVGSVFFGYGLVTIFTTTFLYTVFVYQRHTASALAFMTCVRYVVACALVPASVPMYERLGPHKALTIPAVLATIMAPVPFVSYSYDAKIRGMSKVAPY